MKQFDSIISYSKSDKNIADAVTNILESRGIRCWIAPRNILPGTEWASSIAEAIPISKIFVLIHSKASNESPQVMREVERAVHYKLIIIPIRIEDVILSKSLEYFVSACHWLDAITPPIEVHIQHLADNILQLLGNANSLGNDINSRTASNGKAFRLGFSLAKVAWYHGENLMWSVLQDQVKTFSADLSLPKDLIESTLSQFTLAKSPEKLMIPNALYGVEARNAISSLIESSLSHKIAATFRLGFGIIFMIPQYELLPTLAQFNSEIKGLSLVKQIENLKEDSLEAGITRKSILPLENLSDDPTKAEEARTLLMKIVKDIDKELNEN